MWPLFVLWNAGLTSVVAPVVAAFTIFSLAIWCFKFLNRDTHIQIRDVSKEHNWSFKHPFVKACYCSVCESLLVSSDGAVCDSCGVCANVECMKKADKKFQCKPISLPEKISVKHHWVKGNLSPGATCDICEDECGCGPGLVDWQCCWCQRSVHSHCKAQLGEVCDYGRYRNLIIPPTSVVLMTRRSRLSRRLGLQSIITTNWHDWSPLIILANRKSGNNDGEVVLSLFCRWLNPAQVVDLAERPPEAALEWCVLLDEKGIAARLLVAGGDGTVGWVLNTVEKLKLQNCPSVAILPLGTGNDLSRVLGWGKEQPNPINPAAVLYNVQKAEITKLDRWKVEISPVRHLGIRLPIKHMFMYNYLSVGVDAQIALDFHKTRESPYYLFSSRIFNKLLYLGYGTQQAVDRDCQDLDRHVELCLDGVKIDLPSIEAIVVMNISSWGAGVQLWEMGMDPEGETTLIPQSFNDGKLEVVALYSSFHIAQLQVGLSKPYRIGQATCVTINLKSSVAVQVDGEPWLQHPAEIRIKAHNQANVLSLVKNE